MNSRVSSLVLGTLSFIIPPSLVFYFYWRFETWAATQGGAVCGMPILAAFALGALSAAILSGLGLVLGTRAFLQIPRPRPLRRVAELVVVGLPVLAVVLIWLALVISEWTA